MGEELRSDSADGFMISFHHVTKRFDDQGIVALDDVSFSMDRGDFYVILGPSGAGKTTLLRLIYRDLRPTRGQILIDNRNISTLPDGEIPRLRRQIGVVFQDFKLLTDRTVFENVALSLLVRKKNKHEINRQVMRALDRVGLKRFRNQNPRTLSGGEQQRVALARALVKDPEILLADEPTGNLDPKFSGDILELLREINHQGTTLLVATHDHRTFLNSHYPCLVLEQGEIVQETSMSTLASSLRSYEIGGTG